MAKNTSGKAATHRRFERGKKTSDYNQLNSSVRELEFFENQQRFMINFSRHWGKFRQAVTAMRAAHHNYFYSKSKGASAAEVDGFRAEFNQSYEQAKALLLNLMHHDGTSQRSAIMAKEKVENAMNGLHATVNPPGEQS